MENSYSSISTYHTHKCTYLHTGMHNTHTHTLIPYMCGMSVCVCVCVCMCVCVCVSCACLHTYLYHTHTQRLISSCLDRRLIHTYTPAGGGSGISDEGARCKQQGVDRPQVSFRGRHQRAES